MNKSVLFKSFISIILVITLILCSFIIITQFTSFSVNAAATNGSWETVGNTINSNLNARTVAYNNKIYIISCNGDLGIFDTTTNTISLGEPIPYYMEMTTISATLYNDKIYVIGARPPSPMLYTFYKYDIASNTWTEGTNMQNAKVGSSITVHDGKIYAAGGFEFGYDDPSYIIDDIQAYDIQKDVWETVGSVQNGENIITAAYNGNYYVLCPVNFTNVKNGIEITSVDWFGNAPEAVVQDENLIYSFEDKDLTIVDLLNDLTYDGAPIPNSVGYGYNGYNSCAAKLYNNKIYVASGSESPLQIYDIASNSWEVGPSLPEGSFNNQMQIINGKIYIIYDEKIICYELDR